MSQKHEFTQLAEGEQITLRSKQGQVVGAFAGLDQSQQHLLLLVPSASDEAASKTSIPLSEIETWSKGTERKSRVLVDGSLNNADVLSKFEPLNTNINSDHNVAENRNANTRADGKGNNSVLG